MGGVEDEAAATRGRRRVRSARRRRRERCAAMARPGVAGAGDGAAAWYWLGFSETRLLGFSTVGEKVRHYAGLYSFRKHMGRPSSALCSVFHFYIF